MIYFYNHPIYRISKSRTQTPVFCFDERQKACLKNLTETLQEGLAPPGTVADDVMDTLHALYFPDSPESASFDVFSDVLTVYISLMCLTIEGSPVDLSQIPVFLAKVQFSMRLRAYHHIYTISIANASQLPKKPTHISAKVPMPKEKASASTRTSRIPVQSRLSRTRSSTSAVLPASKKSPSLTSVPTLETKGRISDHGDDESESDTKGSDLDFEEEPQRSRAMNKKTEYDMEKETHRRAQESGPIDMPKRQTWYTTVISWVDIYLTETNVSPYASIRQFMHLSSTMLVDKHTFEVSQFVDFVQYQLEGLEKFIKDKVLFGCSLEDLDISCDFKTLEDTKDVKTKGYGCLLSDGMPLNPDAERFYLHLQKQGKLFSLGNNGTEWDTGEVEVWVQSIALALKRLCVVCHILQGSPGRGTEELLMQISNSDAGRRHLFVDNIRGTLVIWSNYWKGTKATGRFKEILRVYPYRSSRLVYAMIRVVRPVELLYHMKTLDDEGKKGAASAYHHTLWASRGQPPHHTLLLEGIPSFFRLKGRNGKKVFDWISGIRLYRHIVVALQRRHFPDSRYTKTLAGEETNIGDLQAGRTGEASTQNYAPKHDIIPADHGLVDHYVAFSQRWHDFMKESTSFEEGRKYVV
ncbi:hypothetical protein EST38_g14634 [Candolleomyces aberdarensis]|uniref:Uncharacterized protein n=1 Tax=Candolleomyces aberdarensis TaxID=2316362 RepID=A0A4Q2CZ54_9AGAR|nr:hypothetical protein EST38_g14634 [Candolleomyces aberdarensis]